MTTLCEHNPTRQTSAVRGALFRRSGREESRNVPWPNTGWPRLLKWVSPDLSPASRIQSKYDCIESDLQPGTQLNTRGGI